MNNVTTSKQNAPEVKNGFTIPKWASKPPSGLHLDVMKEGKMIQKLMIDEKNCYFFGRNKDTCEFVIDHASCSRVHAVLLWHKHLNRSFLIDLNSTHGTFIGSLRLEPNKPQQVFVDSELKFGASTRSYIIRERPQTNKNFPSILNNSNVSINDSTVDDKEDSFNQSLNLPESEAELDNLTEFNTAHNKRIAQLVDITATTNTSLPSNLAGIGPVLVKRKKKTVTFNEEEDIINPEDIDPNIGKFRNLVQTTVVIPKKKKRTSQEFQADLISEKRIKPNEIKILSNKLVENEEEEEEEEEENTLYDDYDTYSSHMGLSLNLAPDVDNIASNEPSILQKQQQKHFEMIHRQTHIESYEQYHEHASFDSKKKYAKESWPGRHSNSQAPTSSNLAPISITTPTSPTHIKTNSHSPHKVAFTLKPTSNPTPPGPQQSTNQPAKRLII